MSHPKVQRDPIILIYVLLREGKQFLRSEDLYKILVVEVQYNTWRNGEKIFSFLLR